MRVLAVMPGLTPEAGAETSLAAVMPYLVRDGVEMHLAVLTKVQTLVPQLRELGITVHDLSDAGGLFGRVTALRRLVKDLRPALLHATLFEATTPAQIVSVLTRCPILVTWANTPLAAGENPRIGPVKRFGVRAVDTVLGLVSGARFHAVTDGVAVTCRRRQVTPASRVRVAERGRDPQRFAPRPEAELHELRRELGLAEADAALLAVGRQDRTKGHVRLLEAFDHVASRHPEAVLLLAGREGSASPEVQARLATLTHRDRVKVLGHRDDIAALQQVATVAVCSSFREGAAGALIEAMASGTPIVTTRMEGLDGVLTDGVNALVVEPEGLAMAMIAALEDRNGAERRAAQARADFLARFTVERSAASLLDVYRWAAR
jgi:glycosyltransferase involved in cell wall biosynthesis